MVSFILLLIWVVDDWADLGCCGVPAIKKADFSESIEMFYGADKLKSYTNQ